MVGKPWNHDTRQTCHVGTIARWGIGIMSPYFLRKVIVNAKSD
jgi:hypothetical protein